MTKTTPMQMPTATVEDLRARLVALPPKPRVANSARETVAALTAEILHATETLGYTLVDIPKIYADVGHTIAPGTLASYLREARPVAKPAARTMRARAPRKGAAKGSDATTLTSEDPTEDDHLVRSFLREGERRDGTRGGRRAPVRPPSHDSLHQPAHGHALPRRDRMVAIGRLGQIGSRITRITDGHSQVLPSAVLDELRKISDTITALQRDLFK